MFRYDILGPSSRLRRTWPLWVAGLIFACYILTYLPRTVGKVSRRWEIRTEINRLKVQRWTKHLHITEQQLECCASEVQSQDLEDLHILEILLLAAKHEGQKTFVELGALDGKTFSNTYMLERCFGWHGLLIEGSPQNFEKLKRNRPSPTNVLKNLAICPPGGPGYVNFSSIGSAVSGDASAMSDSFREKWKTHQGSQFVRVPCQPLEQVMREAGMPSVAFISLDVEGAEHKVISSVNPAAFQVIIVELDGHDMKKDYEVHKVISHAGLVQPFKSMGYSENQERNPTAVNIARSGIYMKEKLMTDYVKAASWFNLFSSPDHAREP